jgi:Ankyrin repeats (3 copies)
LHKIAEAKVTLLVILIKKAMHLYVLQLNQLNEFIGIMQRLINEPTIDLNNIEKIFKDEIEVVSEMENNENFSIFQRKIKDIKYIMNKIFNAIIWKKEKISAIKVRLFEAVNKQDTKLTFRYAHELYTITRNFRDINGDTVLHIAVLIGNIDIIRILLYVFPNLLFIKNNDGQTPIHIAAAKGMEGLKTLADLIENKESKESI